MEILMVDDEPDLDFLIKQRFRTQIKDGTLTFHFARNGIEALKIAASLQDLRVVISDLNMPGMGGIELLMQLKKAHPDLTVVMLSAYGDDQSKTTALRAGAHAFITKPVNFKELNAILDDLQPQH